MSEKTRKIIIICLLPLAIIWAINNISDKSKDNPADQQELTASKHSAIAHSNKLDSNLIEEYNQLKWGADPFFKGAAEHKTKYSPNTIQSWHLAGILYNANNPHAVINSKIVKKGDSIEGAEIIKINKDRVILSKNGSKFTLSISKDES